VASILSAVIHYRFKFAAERLFLLERYLAAIPVFLTPRHDRMNASGHGNFGAERGIEKRKPLRGKAEAVMNYRTPKERHRSAVH
jgi:hypothetical protein